MKGAARVAAACLLLSAVPAASRAGELAVEAHVGYFDMAAQKSANALFGSSGGVTFGGAVRYDVWRGVFVSAGVRTFEQEGERVFVGTPSGPVQKLGFPLSLRLTPVLLTAGYRLRQGKLISPYAAIGAAITSYSEKSVVAGESFDNDGTKTGFIVTGGVDVGRGMFRGGVELGYTTVPSAIGLAGVSKVYGEEDLGGFHVVGRVMVVLGLGGSKAGKP